DGQRARWVRFKRTFVTARDEQTSSPPTGHVGDELCRHRGAHGTCHVSVRQKLRTIGPVVLPGSTTETCTPSGDTSCRSAALNADNAAFEAQYPLMAGTLICSVSDVVHEHRKFARHAEHTRLKNDETLTIRAFVARLLISAARRNSGSMARHMRTAP